VSSERICSSVFLRLVGAWKPGACMLRSQASGWQCDSAHPADPDLLTPHVPRRRAQHMAAALDAANVDAHSTAVLLQYFRHMAHFLVAGAAFTNCTHLIGESLTRHVLVHASSLSELCT
jgi:hypothetical protein